jgi:hypothetical protein
LKNLPLTANLSFLFTLISINIMDTKKVLYDNRLMRLEYDVTGQCLYHIWESFTRTEQYKETLEILQAIVADLQPQKLLVDQRKRKVLSREASAWFVKEWFPKFSAQLKTNIKIAFVEAEDAFGKATAHDNITQLERLYVTPLLLQYKYFDDYEVAEKWLNQ